MGLTYENSGVDYVLLDAFKRACQRAAATTTGALREHGLTEPAGIRGESAYLLETPDEFLAHVEEGLGTKNLIADAMLELTGRSFYANIGIDTVATIVNDLATTGALPISVAMHAAVGDASWFAQASRAQDLARGFAEGCRRAGAVWSGGETPALQGIVNPKAMVLAGSAIGRIRPKTHRIVGDLADGDAIILLSSAGVQTNGLTLCRTLSQGLPQGYLTPLGEDRTFGEALLDASEIYTPFVAECQRRNVRLKYASHITGHGWRKLMRLDEPFVYRMTSLPPVPEVMRFIAKHGPVDVTEMYATFNMGAGFAAYVAGGDVRACLDAAKAVGIDAWPSGVVAKQGQRKAVLIEPLAIVFEGDSLQVR
ncbi:MAG TPA: AIR synthase related protein [Tepidisphaeraceae bacterium]|jgi:phosphoribosylformylglycinamidine cyclo-ligase|nr:AIR synthase related protein [Tepidisphaeraceae bacterium]